MTRTRGYVYCSLATPRVRGRRAMRHVRGLGLYGLLYGFLLYFAVFRCISLHTCDSHRHASPGAIQPYSAV